jgi:hypothetical protein
MVQGFINSEYKVLNLVVQSLLCDSTKFINSMYKVLNLSV